MYYPICESSCEVWAVSSEDRFCDIQDIHIYKDSHQYVNVNVQHKYIYY